MLRSLALVPTRPVVWTVVTACAGLATAAALLGAPWPVAALLPTTAVAWAILSISMRSLLDARDGRVAELAQTDEARQQLLRGAGVGTWIFDVAIGRVIYDATCSTMLGYRERGIDSTLSAWGKLLHPDDAASARKALDALCDGTQERYETRIRLRAADGSWRTVLDRGSVVARDRNGKPLRIAGVHVDITTEAEQARSVVRPRWAIVDDDDGVRAVLRRIATRAGVEPIEYANADTAWAALRETPPEGVITDFEMPGMSGVELARRLRANGAACPIVLVSGSPEDSLGDCEEIDAVFGKPFALDDLVATVRRLAVGPRKPADPRADGEAPSSASSDRPTSAIH